MTSWHSVCSRARGRGSLRKSEKERSAIVQVPSWCSSSRRTDPDPKNNVGRRCFGTCFDESARLQPHVGLASALFPESCEPIALLEFGVADTNMGQKGKQVRVRG